MQNDKDIFAPIPNRRIFEKVSDSIKNSIFDGLLKIGDQLPTETEMAKRFQVSRPTIREAIRLLEVSGFISINRGGTGGPVIADTIFDRISQLYLDAFRMKRVTLAELTVARLQIEKNVLEHIFDRIDSIRPHQTAVLNDNLIAARSKLSQGARATKENLDFHRLIAKLTGNHVYVIILESLMAVLGDLLSRLAPDLAVGTMVVNEHRLILEAILQKDRKSAIAHMERHLREVEGRLQKIENLTAAEQQVEPSKPLSALSVTLELQ